MSIKDVIAKLKKAHEAYIEKADINALAEIYAPDILVHMPPFPDIIGLEAYKQSAAAAHQGFTDRSIEWEETIIRGSTVAHRYTTRDKHTGLNPMIPVPPTGKEVVTKGSVFYYVKKNKIVEEFWYVDLLGYFQQLGIVPPMGEK
jgi:predicted ester cyclase